MRAQYYKVITLLVLLLVCVVPSFSQSYKCVVLNETQTSPNTLEFDLFLQNLNPAVPVRIAALQLGITVNPGIENGGILTAKFVEGTSEVVLGGVPAIRYEEHCIKIAPALPAKYEDATFMKSTGSGSRFYRIRLTNSKAFAGLSKSNLDFCFTTNQPYKTKFAIYNTDKKLVLLDCNSSNCFSQSENNALKGFQLNVANTLVKTSKSYDGTNQALATMGTISGIQPGDETRLTVTTSAQYDNSTSGTAKTITVSYLVTGTAAGQYIPPASYEIKNGEILPLTIKATNTGVQLSKPYDGTPVANVSGFRFQGVIPADTAFVKLQPVAKYADSEVGSGKSITVTYSLSGDKATNYRINSDTIIANGRITARMLQVRNPVVVKAKMYDGNAVAVVKSTGEIEGFVPGDDVSLFASAHYDDEKIGQNKRIVLIYQLNGFARRNYQTPSNDTVFNASILETLALKPVQAIEAVASGDTLKIPFEMQTGLASQYKLIFTSKETAAGFVNSGYISLGDVFAKDTVRLFVPENVPAGNYDALLQVSNELGSESPVAGFSFTINLSASFIINKFGNLLLFDNSSKEYTAYQWYKNGLPILGATAQYYCDNDGLSGYYSVKVTNAKGESFFTNSRRFDQKATRQVKVYPNPVGRGKDVHLILNGFEDQELKDASLKIYTMQGVCVYESSAIKEDNMLSLQLSSQLCRGRLTLRSGMEYNFTVVFE